VRVTPLTAQLALMTSEEDVEMGLRDGSVVTSGHVFTMLWKREPTGWKMPHSHESWIDRPTE
jgi:ketosteroid isomerase-like protein